MDFRRACPICYKQYNQLNRRQMIICLNQHYICEDCADQINKKQPKCPYCKEPYNIKKIRPRRRSPITKSFKSFCKIAGDELKSQPKTQKDKTYQNRIGWKAGSKFGEFASSQWRCPTCRFVICYKCLTFANHSKQGCSLCQENLWCGSCRECFIRKEINSKMDRLREQLRKIYNQK